MDSLIDQYLTSVRVEGGLAQNTLAAYRRDLQKLKAFSYTQSAILILWGYPRISFKDFWHSSKRNNGPQLPSRDVWPRYADFIDSMGLNSKSREYSVRSPVLGDGGCDCPNLVRSIEVTNLLELPVSQGHEDLRDSAMVELLYATGLRVSELISLELS